MFVGRLNVDNGRHIPQRYNWIINFKTQLITSHTNSNYLSEQNVDMYADIADMYADIADMYADM